MDRTPEKAWEAKAVLGKALNDGETVILDSFGFDANAGGDTLIFKIGDDTLSVSPFWLDDCNIVDGPMFDEELDDEDES